MEDTKKPSVPQKLHRELFYKNFGFYAEDSEAEAAIELAENQSGPNKTGQRHESQRHPSNPPLSQSESTQEEEFTWEEKLEQDQPTNNIRKSKMTTKKTKASGLNPVSSLVSKSTPTSPPRKKTVPDRTVPLGRTGIHNSPTSKSRKNKPAFDYPYEEMFRILDEQDKDRKAAAEEKFAICKQKKLRQLRFEELERQKRGQLPSEDPQLSSPTEASPQNLKPMKTPSKKQFGLSKSLPVSTSKKLPPIKKPIIDEADEDDSNASSEMDKGYFEDGAGLRVTPAWTGGTRSTGENVI